MNKVNVLKRYKVSFYPVIFIGVFLSLLYYNLFSISILEKNMEIKYQNIVDVTKRFHGYYINANKIQLSEGIHEINNVGVIVNKAGLVKVLSPAISLLHQSLSEVINKKYLWSIAVVEKLHDENTGNSYFKPLRDIYITFNDKILHDSLMLDRIVQLEDLNETYKGFHRDDIKITEAYKELGTNEEIHSIIYPIYLKRKLVSVIIVDVKEDLNQELIREFDDKKWIFIDNKKGISWLTFNIILPYSSENAVYNVSVNISKLLLISIYITTIVYLIILFIHICFLKIEHRLHYDAMTNFYRRDFYEKKLDQLDSTYILMIDIDHFKRVNDSYGHDVGDNVIKQVAFRIRKHIREKDIAIRWGGEEFIIIFPYMHISDFVNKAEKLRLCIESELIDNIAVTISLGGVEKKESEPVIDAIQRADLALYQSKNSGRNRVTINKNQHET